MFHYYYYYYYVLLFQYNDQKFNYLENLKSYVRIRKFRYSISKRDT